MPLFAIFYGNNFEIKIKVNYFLAGKGGRCYYCPRNLDRKTNNHCSECSIENMPIWVCSEHSRKVYVCNTCYDTNYRN